MQLLALAIEAIAANGAIDLFSVLRVKVVAKAAKVIVGITNVLQFTRDEFDDNHVIEIADNRNVVGQNIFGITKVNEHGQ